MYIYIYTHTCSKLKGAKGSPNDKLDSPVKMLRNNVAKILLIFIHYVGPRNTKALTSCTVFVLLQRICCANFSRRLIALLLTLLKFGCGKLGDGQREQPPHTRVEDQGEASGISSWWLNAHGLSAEGVAECTTSMSCTQTHAAQLCIPGCVMLKAAWIDVCLLEVRR